MPEQQEIETTVPQKLSPRNKIPKWLKLFFLFCLIFIGIITLTAGGLAYQYKNKIYPGIKISGLKVGGLTTEQADKILHGQFKQIYGNGFVFSYENNEKIIANDNILKLDAEGTIDSAFALGHEGSFLKRHWQVLLFPIFKKNINFKYSFDKEILKSKISEAFSIYEKPAQSSEPIITIINAKEKTFSLNFSKEKTGELFYVKGGIQAIENSLPVFNNPKIELSKQIDYPTITQNEAEQRTDEIRRIMKNEEITFFYEDQSWPISWETIPNWLVLTKNENILKVTFKDKMLQEFLEAISQEINRPATDAKLNIKDNKVIEFSASQNGQELDIERSKEQILKDIFEENKNASELIVKETEPKISVEKTNDLGIKDLLGTGISNFAGSPSNRRHNIGIGTATLNGILLKPGEEFSLVKSLGEIDSQNGYLPELVIKKEGTVPEYGGGLCQVATTIFRGVLDSGLKITSRRNHSYRVVYYEPAGTDATIYNPTPDFKFINDTANHILIQTKLSGDNLYYQIWGTADGRKIRFEGLNTVADIKDLKPKIFNITNPGPALEVITTALKPGERRQTEKSHAGADAEFTRYIQKIDQPEEKEIFSSHYIPWRAVFMVGQEIPEPIIEQPPNENNETN
ncbi:MAG: VanW family protein [Patescibacteria group bacterium]